MRSFLGKVQRKMNTLAISNQGPSTSRKVENQGVGGGILQGVIPNVKNDPSTTQEMKQRLEISQMNRTIRQMQNELTRLRRDENFVPTNQNPRILIQEQRRNHVQEQRMRQYRDEEHRKRAPRVPNPNVVVMEEIFEEENFENYNQEANNIQDEILELVQMDEGESSFYIFNEQEEFDILQENVVQMRAQINKFKTKEVVKKEKEKTKANPTETTKQQIVFNQEKNPQKMTYNVIDDLTKLRITFPFMEVVKIPQQRENILNILDEPSNIIEVVVTNSRKQQNSSSVKPRGKVPPFYITIENHDVVLHNCLVDSGATNNIIPLSVMEALGMGCTKYYETSERIYAIDSRKVPTYGEIKYFVRG
jgi:hypothetical protein